MYKDKQKQREAQRERTRRYRDKQKGVTSKGVTQGVTSTKRGKDIKCFEDLPLDVQQAIDKQSDTPEEKAKRTAAAIKYQHLFPESYEPGIDDGFTRLLATASPGHQRVSKPGDEDYVPMCETTRAFMEGQAG